MRTSNIVQKSQSSREVSGNAVAMTIDEASSVFLMDALGKLYSRPAQAVLREYLSNAVDAHKAKGGKLPAIQITLPEEGRYQGSAMLRIRDFGKGMTEEEFGSILSRYGASTKRDSNAMIGGFGLGAKSGFALSDEFFMTSHQQGKAIRVRIFKDNLNQGYVEVVDRFATKEADGILVEVPIPRGNVSELSKKSLYTDFPFFMGYGVDVIDVIPAADYASQSVHNSETFAAFTIGGNTVGWMSKKAPTQHTSPYALVGKVAYRIDLDQIANLNSSHNLDKDVVAAIPFLRKFRRTHVIDVPIGSVDMPSAREEITYSERSVKTISAIICNYAVLMKQQIQKELNSKKTKLQVIKFLADLEGEGYPDVRSLTWKGISFDKDFFKNSAVSYTTYTQNTYGNESVTHEMALGIKTFRALRHLSDKTEYSLGLHRIAVESGSDVVGVRKVLTQKILSKFLADSSTPTSRLYSRSASYKGLFVVVPEGDVLSEWIFGLKDLEVSTLKDVLIKEEQEKKAEAERQKIEQEKKAAAREKARKAQITRAQSMLSNFLVNSGSGKSLSRNTVEQVFKDDKVKKYYWSEEEVAKHVTSKPKYQDRRGVKVDGIHFPFTASKVPNTFNVLTSGSSYYRSDQENYLIRLRSFLRMFIEDGSKMIVIAQDTDLDEFKKTYPSVESGVELVSQAIKSQVKDANSELMVAYNAIGDSRFKDKSEIRNLTKFSKALNSVQFASLNEELTSALERFQVVISSSEAGGRGTGLDDKYFLAMLQGFVPAKHFKENSYSVETDVTVLSEKYPLLMKGSFNNFSTDIIEHMFDYIKMCETK